jgi:hypothetical protein
MDSAGRPIPLGLLLVTCTPRYALGFSRRLIALRAPFRWPSTRPPRCDSGGVRKKTTDESPSRLPAYLHQQHDANAGSTRVSADRDRYLRAKISLKAPWCGCSDGSRGFENIALRCGRSVRVIRQHTSASR